MDSLDIVIPVFNEADGVREFHTSLKHVASGLGVARVRYIYVNDGSTDGTQAILEEMAAGDPDVAAIELSRNFGHQAALAAGLDACGDSGAVVMMDGDGQHPPSLLPEMLRLHAEGYDIVQTQRRDGGASVKHFTSRAFYWLISRLGGLDYPEGTADFRLVSGAVLRALREVREYHRFYRGILPWLGFRTALLAYAPADRLAGASKYTPRKMLRLAAEGLFSLTLLPLQIGLVLGLAFLVLAAVEILYVASLWLGGQRHALAPGWSSLIVMMTIGFGVIMILLGFVGIYVGMIFQEVKRRPVYVVRSTSGAVGWKP